MARSIIVNTAAGATKLSKRALAAVDALAKAKGSVVLAVAYLKQHAPDMALCERQVWRIKHMPQVRGLLLQKAQETVVDHAAAAADRLGALLDSPSEKVKLDAAKHLLACSGIKPPDGPGTRINIAVMSPDAVAWQKRTGQTIRTRQDREEFEQLKAQGALAGIPGYVLDWSPQDNEEGTQLGHLSQEDHGSA
jgi:hypothetical protein